MLLEILQSYATFAVLAANVFHLHACVPVVLSCQCRLAVIRSDK